jgi:hypothetical protein
MSFFYQNQHQVNMQMQVVCQRENDVAKMSRLMVSRAFGPLVPGLRSAVSVASMQNAAHVESRTCACCSYSWWECCRWLLHQFEAAELRPWLHRLQRSSSADLVGGSSGCDATSSLRMQRRPSSSRYVVDQSSYLRASCTQRCLEPGQSDRCPCQGLAVSKLRCNQHSARRKARGLHGPWIPW